MKDSRNPLVLERRMWLLLHAGQYVAIWTFREEW